MPFVDRYEAGRRLAERLPHLRGEDVVVLGLPRGGVPVASEVARAIGAPMDVIVVRKLGVPYQPELAMGALGEDGALVVDADMVRRAHASEAELAELERRARAEIEQRVRRFRAVRPRIPLAGRTAVVVDDGIRDRFDRAGGLPGGPGAGRRPRRAGRSGVRPRHGDPAAP